MKKSFALFMCFFAIVLVPPCLCASVREDAHPIPDAQKQEWIAALSPARVKVAYTLQFAEGETPTVPGLVTRYLCPNCGSYHTRGNDAERSVHDKRAVETWGWLVEPQTVLVQDAQIPDRFLKDVRVAQGQESVAGQASVAARIDSYFRTQKAALLTLDAPLPNASPLAFTGNTEDEGYLLSYTRDNEDWQSVLAPYVPEFVVDEVIGVQRIEGTDGIVLDSSGTPVRIAVAGREEFCAQTDAQTGMSAPHWEQWEKISMEEDARRQERIASYHGTSLCLATLHFRSPRNTGGEGRYDFGRDDGDSDNAIQYAVACQLVPGRFLVLKNLAHGTTARLEKILITTAASGDVEATFVASLAEFGAFIVDAGPPRPSGTPPQEGNGDAGTGTPPQEGNILPISDTPSQIPLGGILRHDALFVKGGDMQSTQSRTRVTSIVELYDGIVFPNDITDDEAGFIFDADCALCFLPIALRFAGEGATVMPYPAVRLRDIVAQLPADALDASNVPLPASEENRTAWAGMEFQFVTPALAIAYNAARFYDNNGRMAGLVTYLYPDSPAERAGLRMGDILLRLHTPRFPLPIPIQGEYNEEDEEFPWEHYDEIPAEAFEGAPTPWSPITSAGAMLLTSCGIGNTCTLDIVRDGQLLHLQFPIELSPPHYGSVERHTAQAYGMTVCDLTFEVRRYFNLKEDAPGIVLVAIEAGSAASERGLKPYEMITHVDATPIHHAADLAALLEEKAEVRLTVKRMNKERVVILKPGKPAKGLLQKLFKK